ncbi:thiamine-phosphate kinase [Halopelagius fulvigenes]|uniref:Thiamine-monophosphate kinase n=1 Tax=Halopelagius fulvigenes TaxID=1198324 RepID=A0ABD5TTK9_9EURY
MDERTALRALAVDLPGAGDDAAVVGAQVVTTDMLHESTDFPAGTTRYTAGWRAVGASLSDVAAMGAAATAAVAAYGAPALDEDELRAFVGGARDVCESVGAEYVGGDLDTHDEFTVATTALGDVSDDGAVLRSGASSGEVVCVTGALGRSAAGLRAFEAGDVERGNDLFRFPPRVASGVAVAPHATAMMDSSDGLARSLHQLAEASDCGFDVSWDSLPVHDAVADYAGGDGDEREMAAYFGEDFELVFTVPESDLSAVRASAPVPVTVVGEVTAEGIVADGEPVPDEGYTHASNG